MLSWSLHFAAVAFSRMLGLTYKIDPLLLFKRCFAMEL